MPNQDELPEELKSTIGRELEIGWGPDEVCKSVIRYWCEALEDGNPLYHDEKFARDNGYDGVIAPPTMAMTLTRPPLWPPPPESVHVDERLRQDFPEGVVQSTEWEFHAPVVVGDRLRVVERLADISPTKVTRLGTGHFETLQLLYYNQRGTLVSIRTTKAFRYRRGSASRKVQTE